MYIGEHVCKGKSFLESLIECSKEGFTAAQIFVRGPQSDKNVIFGDGEKAAIKSFIDKNDFKLFVHANYMSTSFTASGEENKIEKNKIRFWDQLKTSDELGAAGLVLHLQKQPPNSIVKSMRNNLGITVDRLKKYKTKVILEMTGVAPDPLKTYETPAKLGKLIDAIKEEWGEISNIGLCIDTAHIFVAGQDISDYKFMKNYLKELDSENITDWVDLIHLNGSVNRCGSHKDTHAVPFSDKDQIWRGQSFKESSFILLKKWMKENRIPCIFEIAGHATSKSENNLVPIMEKMRI